MTMQHAKSTPIARAVIAPTLPNENKKEKTPEFALLFLDDDAVYRWYEADQITDAASTSLRRAITLGRLRWPKLEVIEIRGQAVVWSQPEQFEETSAVDELCEMAKRKPLRADT